MVVIGATNHGKSTFLNNVTQMFKFFNTSVMRETAHVWKFRLVPDFQQQEGPILYR